MICIWFPKTERIVTGLEFSVRAEMIQSAGTGSQMKDVSETSINSSFERTWAQSNEL